MNKIIYPPVVFDLKTYSNARTFAIIQIKLIPIFWIKKLTPLTTDPIVKRIKLDDQVF